VAEWLGLDLQSTYQVSADYDNGTIVWASVAQEQPRHGQTNRGFYSDGERTVCTGETWLDGVEVESFRATVGPRPRLMTRDEELRLKGLLYEQEREQ
jgi:hypothetical protein